MLLKNFHKKVVREIERENIAKKIERERWRDKEQKDKRKRETDT